MEASMAVFVDVVKKESDKLCKAYQREIEQLDNERKKLKEEKEWVEKEKAAYKEKINSEFLAREEKLRKAEEDLQAKMEAFEKECKEMQAKYREPEKVVDLNCGGALMATLLDTLTKVPGSMLAAMFSGHHPITKDKQGRAFIDRDPDLFKYVLNYLRTDEMPEISDPIVQRNFERELVYFGLADLSEVELIQDLFWEFSGNGIVAGKTFTTSQSGGWCASNILKGTGNVKFTINPAQNGWYQIIVTKASVGQFPNPGHKVAVSPDVLASLSGYYQEVNGQKIATLPPPGVGLVAVEIKIEYDSSNSKQLRFTVGGVTVPGCWPIPSEYRIAVDVYHPKSTATIN